jgi:tetratricopeptide (TPR) repeat protein
MPTVQIPINPEQGVLVRSTAAFLGLVIALAAISANAQLDPGRAVSAHYQSAVDLEQKGRIDDAIAEYRKAIHETPHHADSHYNLGRLLAAKGDHQGARAEFLQAVQLRPDDPDYHNNLGLELKNAGDLKGAALRYREALRLDPSRPEAHLNLGNLFYLQRKLDAAEKEYRAALKLNPQNAVAHMSLGNVLDDGGSLDGAIAEYKEAIRLEPGNANAHYNLAIALAKKRDPATIPELRRAMELAPAWPLPRVQLVKLLKRTDPKEAIDACHAPEPVSSDPDLRKLCAEIVGSQGPAQPAATTKYPSTITLGGFSGPANGGYSEHPVSSPKAEGNGESGRTSTSLFAKGSGFFLQRDYRNAATYYQQALDLEKKKPMLSNEYWHVLVDNLAMAYGIPGDLIRSKEVLEYGLAKDPTYPNFYYTLACVYAEMGDLDHTLSNLKIAFHYRQNLIAGEQMPDPRTDDSFQRFKNNERFQKLIASLPSD